ncbi:hypothetical protein LUZ60_017706 [Juncus effusus]|nr:hypothetical protein LUZ60_017706 [Juncus effusus]
MAVQDVVSFVVNKLGESLVQEAMLQIGLGDQVDSIKLHFRRMLCFLKEADSMKNEDERVKGWVRDIREAAYEIEDAIDEFHIEVARVKRKGLVLRYVLKPVEWYARHNLGSKITTLQARIREICDSRLAYGIPDLGQSSNGEVIKSTIRKPVLFPEVDDPEIVGLENDKLKITEQLLDGNVRRRCVISIVGTGGLGKTTLARKVYNNKEIKWHFDQLVWLYISQEFNLTDLLKKAVEIINKSKDDNQNKGDDYYARKLNKTLRGKRYLIVMDDVWTTNLWEGINEILPDDKNGSRVLMTTRFLNVAKRADPSSPPYELQLLNEKESLELLLKKVFLHHDPVSCCPAELMGLARDLAKRCDGLPLALVVLGGLLSIKEISYSSWYKVAQTLNWQSDGKECMDILVTSYEDLPYYLKSCFMYLASFPEDYEIQARSLIKMWIAEGFLQHEQIGIVEDTAERYLEELVQRCMVQATRRSSNGTIKSCRVHDLLLEMAIDKANKSNFLVVNPQFDRGCCILARRIALHHRFNGLKKHIDPHLRSILTFSVQNPEGISFELLKVIELQGATQFQNLPHNLNIMIHLTYLGLRATALKCLPSSIRHLTNLQTLDIRDTHIISIPDSLWGIPSLRHVNFSKTRPVIGPLSSSNLLNLQTLGAIQFPQAWERELPHFPALRKLQITNFSNFDWKAIPHLLEKLDCLISFTVIGRTIPIEVVQVSSIPSYHHMQSLHLEGVSLWGRQLDLFDVPPNLTKLTLIKSELKEDPMPKFGKLKSLKILRLIKHSYGGTKLGFSTGGFPKLQTLELEELWQLEELVLENGTMPMISRFFIKECKKLKMLPNMEHLSSLQELVLCRMPYDFSQRAAVFGDDKHKIKHVPSIVIR